MIASKINHGPESRRPLNGTGVLRISELASKNSPKIATWNVRSLLKAGKLANVLQEIKRINILGLSETKWPGTKKFTSKDHHVFCSGGEENTKQMYGVAFAVHKQLANKVTSFTPISELIALLQLAGNKINLNLLQVYAPTADKDDQEIELFYDQLSNTLKPLKKHDITVILGDFNAKVDQGKLQNIVGEHGLGTRNERGDRLIQFCQEAKCSIANTWFKLPPRRLYTWTSPQDSDNNIVRNQINYILINTRYKSSVLKAKTYPGADISSDHNPVTATLRLKLRSAKRTSTTKRIDLEKLKNNTIRQQLQLHLNTTIQSIEAATTNVQANPARTSGTEKETTMDDPAHSRSNGRAENIQKQQQPGKIQRNTTKDQTRKAKEKWMEEQCAEIEDLIKKNDNFNLHKKLKEVRSFYKLAPIPSLYTDNNQPILSKRDELDTWKNYICNLFGTNRKPAETQQQVQEDNLHILTSEVEHAIRRAKSGKACGPDQTHVELLKQLDYIIIQQLTKWFNQIYNNNVIPSD
ncbi:craniofacial development protein 2-like [Centruroides vittatus]|uniref:craniofacial development protein 2-like n=1 Tax=Centruroides vittatus TaxID=120091 RepID=UPI00350FBE57